MNDINLKQNQDNQIDKLAAQRFLYSRAKLIFITRLIISIAFAVLGPIVIFQFNDIKIYVAVVATFYTIFNFLLLRMIENRHRMDGAKIQELFDTELFNLPWNKIVAGEKPEKEKIFLYSKKYKFKNDIDTLKNWYPKNINELDLLPAVAVCQRTNIWWDVTLREKLFWSLVLFMFVLTFVIFLTLSKNSENLFLFIVFLLPFYETLIDYTKSQFSAVNRIKKLKVQLDDIIENISDNSISDDTLVNNLRIAQDEIFRHRESCLFVPDWFYKIFRDSQEGQMNYNAKHYVDIILHR